MAVPTTGSFLMFGNGSNTTIAGAIIEGGANAEAISSTLNFNSLKGLANIARFDPAFKEGASNLNQIVKTSQFRGYPIPTTTSTTTTTQAPCSIIVYFNSSASPSPGGWDTQTEACEGTGTPLTVYTIYSATCPTTFQEIFNDGKILYTNSALTTVLNGGDKFFKDTSAPNSGNTLQIGPDGFIDTVGAPCSTTTTTTTTTATTSTTTTTTTTTTAAPTTTTSTTTTTTTTTAAPDCYVYEYINNSSNTINVNGTECSGSAYSLPVAPGGEGTTFCLQQLSQPTIDAYAALGLVLTQGATTCDQI